MNQTFRTSRRVQFRDTDMAGIVHFSVFFTYMEVAEHDFLRSLGMSVIAQVDGREISWPRVSAECDYRRAIRFEQVIEIELAVTRIGEKSITYSFRFLENDQAVAEGKVTAVCCHFEHGIAPKSVPIPETLRKRLEPFLIQNN